MDKDFPAMVKKSGARGSSPDKRGRYEIYQETFNHYIIVFYCPEWLGAAAQEYGFQESGNH
jgi:hypothetical protein